ncbi:MAG: hypothetical protein ACRC49_01415, partial [Plesiomonas sp.]
SRCRVMITCIPMFPNWVRLSLRGYPQNSIVVNDLIFWRSIPPESAKIFYQDSFIYITNN